MSKTDDQPRGRGPDDAAGRATAGRAEATTAGTPGATTAGTPGTTTRERLLHAAVVVGARTGWGGITTRAVAAEAGVIPGVVHYHLGSVAALRREAVRTALETVAAESLGALQAATDAPSALSALLASPVGAPPSDAAALVHEAYLAAGREPEVRALLAENLAAFRGLVATWVDEVTAGRPDREDPAALAAALVAAVDGLYLHRLLDPTVDAAAVGGPLLRAVVGCPGGPDGTR